MNKSTYFSYKHQPFLVAVSLKATVCSWNESSCPGFLEVIEEEPGFPVVGQMDQIIGMQTPDIISWTDSL